MEEEEGDEKYSELQLNLISKTNEVKRFYTKEIEALLARLEKQENDGSEILRAFIIKFV